jgi:hypothetical protein
MAIHGSVVYLSTILLEKNRWNGKGPSLLVSDWIEPIGEDGFVGVDLWMNHLRFSSRSEWELIKAKSTDTDVALAIISAVIPTDASDKSQRLRDGILEACDYFHPENLKFSLIEDSGMRSKASDPEVSLEFIRTWAQDLPKDINLLFDVGQAQVDLESINQARKILTGSRFKLALQPFLLPPKEFEAILAATGEFLGNLGVQSKSGKEWRLLADDSTNSLQIIGLARSGGFKGTWTLDYTKGVGIASKGIDDLFDNAEKDLNYLTEAMARAGRPSRGGKG